MAEIVQRRLEEPSTEGEAAGYTLCSEHPHLWIIVLLIRIFLLLQELTNHVWAQKGFSVIIPYCILGKSLSHWIHCGHLIFITVQRIFCTMSGAYLKKCNV